MNEDFLDILSRSTPAEARERLGLPARELDAQVLQRTTTVDGESDSPEREAIFAYTAARWSESTLEARRAAAESYAGTGGVVGLGAASGRLKD
jgi:hypothetical protein